MNIKFITIEKEDGTTIEFDLLVPDISLDF